MRRFAVRRMRRFAVRRMRRFASTKKCRRSSKKARNAGLFIMRMGKFADAMPRAWAVAARQRH